MSDYEKERQEAIDAGEKALASLEDAKKALDSAHGWGTYDTWFGGGMVSSLIKHSRMSDASECITNAENDLKAFSDELKDIDLEGVNLETADTLGTIDAFFDNFFSDLLMQDRIKEAQSTVDQTIKKVEAILQALK